MKFKFLVIAIITCFFNINYSMNNSDIITIIEKNEVEKFVNLLNAGLDVNTRMASGDTMLLFALGESDMISQILISRGANVNTPMRRFFYISLDHMIVTPLFKSLVFDHISLETVKLLLDRGADINFVFELRSLNLPYVSVKKSLFDCLAFENVREHISEEKRQFIIDYLIKYYGKEVLPIALTKCDSLVVIEKLVVDGAFIPENIIDIARKLKVDKSIIDFLQRQFDIKKVVNDKISSLPTEVNDIISYYSQGPEQNTADLLLESITNKKIHFIKTYIKLGCNPNIVIKFNNETRSLFFFAIQLGAEEIANFLMENGADINLHAKTVDSGLKHIQSLAPLYVAFENKNISVDFIKKMLDKAANIDNVYIKNSKQVRNLASLLCRSNSTKEKWCFVLDYLMKRFGKNILDFVLEGSTSLDIVKNLVKNGAIVNRYIIEKAKKYEHSEEIIKYLNGILQLNEQFIINNIMLPEYPIALINDYYSIEESAKKDNSNKCIVC